MMKRLFPNRNSSRDEKENISAQPLHAQVGNPQKVESQHLSPAGVGPRDRNLNVAQNQHPSSQSPQTDRQKEYIRMLQERNRYV